MKKSFINESINLSLILVVGLSLTIMGCGDRTKKDSDNAQGSALTNQADNNAVESAPMNFDPQGSDSGKINGLVTVNFEYDKSTLSAESKKKIDSNVEWMKANSKVKVQIEGHCDARGSIEYNLALGERRANSVKKYMEGRGISADRLSTISYGKEKPLATGDSEGAWAKNRRANFVPSAQ